MIKQVQLLIKGRVQGVFFRASTQQKATQLGLAGYVQNLNDGRVCVVAIGEQDRLQKLIEWCHDGPRHAQVEHVDIRIQEIEQRFDNFEIR